MSIVISTEHVSKKYRLGSINSRSLRDDLLRSWARLFKRPDPIANIVDTPQPPGEHGTIWALRDINFEIKEGESVGIIGRNGAGKSTLLKILSHITSPTEGKIKIKGRISSLLEVGTGFHPELTGRENVYLNGSILGMKRIGINRKFDEIVEFSGISQFIDTPVKRYSSGMYMRLAFAVAAHLDSDILILDEVISVGDAAFQKKCLDKMSEASHSGRTVLFVSHSMPAVRHLCKRGIYLVDGKVISDDEVDNAADVYLESVMNSELLPEQKIVGYKEWTTGRSEPGVEEFKLLSVRVIDSKDRVTPVLDISKPFWIEIRYKITRALPYCRVGINILSNSGELIFEAYDSDDFRYTGPREPGSYIARCEIPCNLFNTQQYFLSVHAGMPNIKYLAGVENALILDIQESSEADDSQFKGAKRDGIVRPKLKWDTEKE